MEIEACFDFELGNRTQIVYKAVAPELSAEYQRTRANIRISDNVLSLTVSADDLVSLRAALNGWLRLIKVADEMIL